MIESVEQIVLKLADTLRAHKDKSILTKVISSRKKLSTSFTSEEAYLKVDCADQAVVESVQRLFPANEVKYSNYLFNVVVRRLIAEFDQSEPNWHEVDKILSLHPGLLSLLFKAARIPEQCELIKSLLSTSAELEKIKPEYYEKIFHKNNLIYLFNSKLDTISVLKLYQKSDATSKQILKFVESKRFYETIRLNHRSIIVEDAEFTAETLLNFYRDDALCSKPILDTLTSDEALNYYRNGGSILTLKKLIDTGKDVPEKPLNDEIFEFEGEEEIKYDFGGTTAEINAISPELHIWDLFFNVQLCNIKSPSMPVEVAADTKPTKSGEKELAQDAAARADNNNNSVDDDGSSVQSVAHVSGVNAGLAAVAADTQVEQTAKKKAEHAATESSASAFSADLNSNNTVAAVNGVLAAVEKDNTKTNSAVTTPPQTALTSLSTSTASSSSSLSASSTSFTPAASPNTNVQPAKKPKPPKQDQRNQQASANVATARGIN